MTLRFLRSLAKVLFCGTIGAVMLSLLPWKLALIAFLFGCLFVFWRGAQTMLILLVASSAYGQFGGVQQPIFSTLSQAIWTPESIGSLVIWINPTTNYVFTNQDFTINVTADGQYARSISNYVGGVANFTNTSTTDSVQWYSSHNGNTNPCLYSHWFGGAGKFRTATLTNLEAEQWTFAVVRCDGAGYGGVNHFFWTGQTYPLYGFDNSETATIYISGGAPGGAVTFASAGDAVWQLITAKFKALDFVVRTNGVQAGVFNSFTHTGFDGYAFMGSFDGSVIYRGDIAELLHYAKALTSNEVWQVETYLRDKHPFVYSGP